MQSLLLNAKHKVWWAVADNQSKVVQKLWSAEGKHSCVNRDTLIIGKYVLMHIVYMAELSIWTLSIHHNIVIILYSSQAFNINQLYIIYFKELRMAKARQLRKREHTRHALSPGIPLPVPWEICCAFFLLPSSSTVVPHSHFSISYLVSSGNIRFCTAGQTDTPNITMHLYCRCKINWWVGGIKCMQSGLKP